MTLIDVGTMSFGGYFTGPLITLDTHGEGVRMASYQLAELCLFIRICGYFTKFFVKDGNSNMSNSVKIPKQVSYIKRNLAYGGRTKYGSRFF